MDRQKPRDNKMYHISEASNLKAHDKVALAKSQSFALFDFQIQKTP